MYAMKGNTYAQSLSESDVGRGVSEKKLIWILRDITKSCHWMHTDGQKSYNHYGTQYMPPTKPIFTGRLNQGRKSAFPDKTIT